MKKYSKTIEDQARGAGLSTIVERNFLNTNQGQYPGPWMDDGQTFDPKGVQSFGAGHRRVRGTNEGSSLDDLPAVANGTTEHHTEDHPNDLLKGKLIFNK